MHWLLWSDLTVEDSKTVDRRKKYTVTPSGIEALKTTKQI